MPSTEKVILAFDYGELRIGVAVGNTLLKIPHPLTTVSGSGMYAKIDQLTEIISKWQPELLVVGIPHMAENHQKNQLINTINNFARRVSRKFNLPAELINEDFTSFQASILLTEQGISGRKQKDKLDQLAACAILQNYFALN